MQALTFPQKLIAVIRAIDSDRRVWLYGDGNNGKTYVLSSPLISAMLKDKGYRCWYGDIFPDSPRIIVHANEPPPENLPDDFVHIHFTGHYVNGVY